MSQLLQFHPVYNTNRLVQYNGTSHLDSVSAVITRHSKSSILTEILSKVLRWRSDTELRLLNSNAQQWKLQQLQHVSQVTRALGYGVRTVLTKRSPLYAVSLEKPIVTQRVKNFPAFMEPEALLSRLKQPETGATMKDFNQSILLYHILHD
jgi:hypothetical protein